MSQFSQQRLKGNRRQINADMIGAEVVTDQAYGTMDAPMDDNSEDYQTIESNANIEQVGSLAIDNPENQVERTYFLEWTTSLRELAKNEGKAAWTVKAGQEGIYQRMIGDSIEATCRATATRSDQCSDLTKVAVLCATLKSIKSEAPVAVGVNMTGVNGSTVTRNGKCYAFIIDSFTDSSAVNEDIHAANALVRSAVMQKYGTWTRESLVSSTMPLPGDKQSVLVPVGHPVIELMHANEKLLGINMQMVEPINNACYCVSAPIVNKCIDELCHGVVDRLPFSNFNEAKATLARVDGRAWDEADGIANAFSETGQLSDTMLDRTFTVTAKVQLKLAFLDEQAMQNSV